MQIRAATHGSGSASSQARRIYDGRVSDVSSEIPAMSATDVIAPSDGLPTPVTVLVAQRGRWSTIERRRAGPCPYYTPSWGLAGIHDAAADRPVQRDDPLSMGNGLMVTSGGSARSSSLPSNSNHGCFMPGVPSCTRRQADQFTRPPRRPS